MMKKLSFVGAALVAMSVAGFAFAGMEDPGWITATATGISTNAGSSSFVIRGTIEAIVVKTTGTGTPDNAITLTSEDGQTIFSKASNTRGTNTYAIAAPLYLASTGAALTDTLYAYNSVTNASYTVAKYGGIPCASKVTLSVVNVTATTTNTTAVKILYRN
jgi:hypothetical protein